MNIIIETSEPIIKSNILNCNISFIGSSVVLTINHSGVPIYLFKICSYKEFCKRSLSLPSCRMNPSKNSNIQVIYSFNALTTHITIPVVIGIDINNPRFIPGNIGMFQKLDKLVLIFLNKSNALFNGVVATFPSP